MEKGNNFSLTGFNGDQSQDRIKECLQQLGCIYIEKFSQQTNILVVNGTWTQKFKIAQLIKNPISCVTKRWVEESYKKKSLQRPDKYLISEKQMFLGTNVAICGFSPDKLYTIQKIISQREGTTITSYRAVDIIRNYNEISEPVDLILASNDEIERAKHAKLPKGGESILPLVGIQWLQDSLKRKRCKFPNDYAVNILGSKPINGNKGKLLTKLKTFMQNDIMDKSGDFLEDTLIYIDKDSNMDFTKLLKSLISVCGGYWTDRFTSVVTHVLVAEIDEPKYQQYKRYGSRIYILRPQWLVDSILLYNRLDEEDYLVRSFKINDQTIKNLIKQQINRNNQNSQTFNSLPGFSDRRIPENSNTLPLLEFQKKQSRNPIKTDIFKGKNFYMPPQIINDPSYSELIKTIKSAGGQTYDKINSKMNVYVVLKDSPKNIIIFEKLIQSKFKCIILSERWVKECLKKNCFMDPNVKVYYHYNAFKFITPLGDFHKFIFEIVGYDGPGSLRIRQLLPVLGSTRTSPNKSEITHIICGPNWQNSQSQQKIRKILNQNNKVKLISSKWLFDCTNQGRTLSFSAYQIKNSETDTLLTSQKKNDENSTSCDKRTAQMENIKVEKLTF